MMKFIADMGLSPKTVNFLQDLGIKPSTFTKKASTG